MIQYVYRTNTENHTLTFGDTVLEFEGSDADGNLNSPSHVLSWASQEGNGWEQPDCRMASEGSRTLATDASSYGATPNTTVAGTEMGGQEGSWLAKISSDGSLEWHLTHDRRVR